MSAEWTAERVLALAPDAASARAGQGLATARKWSGLGRGEGMVWGECQGSGKDPYRAKVDPEAAAFSCSCPSRKFPCKHGLALMLVWASGTAPIPEGSPPPWVVSWRENREKRAGAKVEKAAKAPSPADSAAKAKRGSARLAKVAAGADELDLWISDVVRRGFAALGARPPDLWAGQARRMVDAQAPGLARRLRQVDAMPLAGDGWQGALLDRLAMLHLLAEGFRRRDSLPPDLAEDVGSAVGLPADLDAARAGPGVRDRWQVIGASAEVDDKVVARRTWLLGRESGRPALVLDFTAGGKPLDPGPVPGTVIDADLAFLPGGFPLRALIRDRGAEAEDLRQIVGGTTIAAAFAAFGEALARSPWMEMIPVVLADVTLVERDGAWSARDAEGSVVPLGKAFHPGRGWHVLALGGDDPVTLAGEFDGVSLHALGFLEAGVYRVLATPERRLPEPRAVPPPPDLPALAEAVASAVLGVDRKGPPAPDDGPIGAALRGLEAREAPARLLALAAATGLSARAGRKPATGPALPAGACPPEDRPEAPAAAAGRFRRMLGGEQPAFVHEWLGLLDARGGRLPHDLLVEVLDRFAAVPSASLPGAGPAILGARGRWLAARNPAWRRLAVSADAGDLDATWAEGTRAERVALLRRLRGSDPARGLALVASTFAKDPAAERSAFLAEFQTGLSMADEPFLEAALDDRSKDVRGIAADWLLRRLPESRLCGRMIARALEALSWDGGELRVILPPEWDKAAARDGLDPASARGRRGGPGAWRLQELLSATPPSAISRALGATPSELIRASKESEWERSLREGWMAASAGLKDADWAEALLDRKGDGSVAEHGLLAALPPGRRDALVLARLRADPGPLRPLHPAFEAVVNLAEPVGDEVGREILARIAPIFSAERKEQAAGTAQAERLRPSELQIRRLLGNLGRALPMALVDEAAALLDPVDGPHGSFAGTFAAAVDRLRSLREMHREFDP